MTDTPPHPSRRALLRGAALLAAPALVLPAASAFAQAAPLPDLLEEAAGLESLETVLIAREGEILAERGFRGHSLSTPTNIKSASKAVVASLIGAAIDRGVLQGVGQRVAPILRADLPADPDPRLQRLTIGHLLSMQAGLRPTSGPNYGRWVASRNWVRAALGQPFEDEPGGRMLYSTGSSHLLSAVLTAASGRSSLANARDWFGAVEGFSIASWERDPQGVYLGGNEMAMSPRSLLAFGELYRRGGLAADGKTRVLSQSWIEASWTRRAASRWSGDGYGYGWFLRRLDEEEALYAWGYGGQMLYIVPRLALTLAMTSDDQPRASTIAHRDQLHALAAAVVRRMRAG